MKHLKETKSKEKLINRVIKSKYRFMVSLIIVAFSCTALLAWNDTIATGVEYTLKKVGIGVDQTKMVTPKSSTSMVQVGESAVIGNIPGAEETGAGGVVVKGPDALVIAQNFYNGDAAYAKITAAKPASMYTQTDGKHLFYTVKADDLTQILGLEIINTGDVNVTKKLTAQNFACSSDERYKKDINPIKSALQKVKALNGISYKWKTEEFKNKQFSNKSDLGFLAQNVESVLPELVYTAKDGYKSVNYQKVTAVLVEAFKEMDKDYTAKISSLEKENADLKEKIAALNKMNQRIAALEKALSKKYQVTKN